MSLYRDIAKHSGRYSLGIFLSKMASVLLLPFYTRYLTPADYGVMELLDLTASVVGMLVGLHMGDAFLYFYSAADTDKDRESVLTTAFAGSAVAAAILAAPAIAMAPLLSRLVFRTDSYGFYFQLTFVNLVLLFPLEIALALLRLHNRSGTLVKLHLLRLGLSVTVNVVLLAGFRIGVASMLWSVLLGNAFLICAASYITLPRRRWTWNGRLFGGIFRYAFPLGLSGFAMLCVNFGDRFFLQRTVSIADIGIYALAYKIGMLVGQLQTVFNMYWTSQMFQLLRQPDGNRTYARVATYYFLVLAGAATFVSVFAYPLLRLLAAPAYIDAARYVPLVAIAYLIKPAGEFLRTVILVEKRPGIDTRINYIGGAVCFVAYALWIPRYRLYGALFATLLAFAVMAVLSLWEAHRIRPVRFEWKRWGIIALAASLSIGFALLAGGSGVIVRAALGVVAMVLFVATLLVTRFFEPRELKALRGMIDRLVGGRAERREDEFQLRG